MTNLWAIEYKSRNGRWVLCKDYRTTSSLDNLCGLSVCCFKYKVDAEICAEDNANPSARPVKVEIIKKEGK